MKHRKLRIAWSVAWAMVAVLLVALWVRSVTHYDDLMIHIGGLAGGGGGSLQGRLTLGVFSERDFPGRWKFQSGKVGEPTRNWLATLLDHENFLGFGIIHVEPGNSSIIVPHRFFVFLTAVLSVSPSLRANMTETLAPLFITVEGLEGHSHGKDDEQPPAPRRAPARSKRQFYKRVQGQCPPWKKLPRGFEVVIAAIQRCRSDQCGGGFWLSTNCKSSAKPMPATSPANSASYCGVRHSANCSVSPNCSSSWRNGISPASLETCAAEGSTTTGFDVPKSKANRKALCASIRCLHVLFQVLVQ